MRSTLPRIGYSNAGFQTAPLLKAGGRRLYASQGGAFAAIANPQTTPVGRGVIEFEDCDHAVFSYEFDAGPSGTMPLLRTVRRPGCVVKPGHPADDGLE